MFYCTCDGTYYSICYYYFCYCYNCLCAMRIGSRVENGPGYKCSV